MNHVEKISRALEEYGLDAMLITSEPGERYALGFQGEGVRPRFYEKPVEDALIMWKR